MISTIRRAALFAAAAAAFVVAAPVQAQTKLKWAHVYETSEPYHTESVWAAEEIKKRTNGKFDIQVFPAIARSARKPTSTRACCSARWT